MEKEVREEWQGKVEKQKKSGNFLGERCECIRETKI